MVDVRAFVVARHAAWLAVLPGRVRDVLVYVYSTGVYPRLLPELDHRIQ